MSDDHEALLSRIGQLAGQINRHKNQHEHPIRPSPAAHQNSVGFTAPYKASRGRGNPYWQPPSRSGYANWSGRGRGRGRGGVPVAHHHRTLVINQPTITPSSSATTGSSCAQPMLHANSTSTTAVSGWVAKRDRHMQLINSSVYDQQIQARAKAMARTLQDRIQRKEAREKLKLNRFLQDSQGRSNHEVEIGGERYRITAGGSKLVRLSGEDDILHMANLVLKWIQLTRWFYPQTASISLLHRRRPSLVVFSFKEAGMEIFGELVLYERLGQCKHGLSCPYIHNPNEVAICPRFLASDSCPDGDMCDLSHDPTPHRVPACHHFLRGNCSNENCRYAHVRVNPAAMVCRQFATLGYCPKGADCTERHVHECPEFDAKGVCTDKTCKLPHIERAGRRRAAAAASAIVEKVKAASNDSSHDSSEDEDSESAGSDVDSDILSEVDFIRYGEENDDEGTLEDFIKF